jgi:hypothetical protein
MDIVYILLGISAGMIILKIVIRRYCCSKPVSKTEPVPVQSKLTTIGSDFAKNTKLRGSAFDSQSGADDLTGARIHPLPLPIPEPIETHSLPQEYAHVVV